MVQDPERVQSRLENIRAVKPILGALRTIALGSWQMALNRRAEMARYAAQLRAMLPIVAAHLPNERWSLRILTRWWQYKRAAPSEPRHTVLLVVGSERGLCGRYNDLLIARAEARLVELRTAGVEIAMGVLGRRIARGLRQQGLPLAWVHSLPVTALPPFPFARELTRRWLVQYEAHELDAVEIVYAAYRGAGRYEPHVVSLIPPDVVPADGEGDMSAVIVDTDPLRLYVRLVGQWASVQMYSLLLEAAASEHSARYRLMESATQNADRVIDELTLILQSARRQAITREMQELAVGAGLLG